MKSSICTAAHLAAAALLVAGANAVAQGYPSKPVRIVLGFPAGTTVDVLARPIAQKLGERPEWFFLCRHNVYF
jgi:tripartite-type tricarboxylate transporter receptor subunit TctC